MIKKCKKFAYFIDPFKFIENKFFSNQIGICGYGKQRKYRYR